MPKLTTDLCAQRTSRSDDEQTATRQRTDTRTLAGRGRGGPSSLPAGSSATMKNEPSPSTVGAVVSVRGSVVDIQFDTHLPPIHSLLHADGGKIAIEVLAQLDAHRVRGIALTPTQGLSRGIALEDTGGPLKARVGKGILSRMFDVFGNAIDRQAAQTDVRWCTVHRAPPALARRPSKSEIFETGIKVIAMGSGPIG